MPLRVVKMLSSLVVLFALSIGPRTEAQEVRTSQPQNAYQQSETLIRAHQWDQGIAALAPILRQANAPVKALNLAGLAYTGKGDLQRADQYFRKALQINPRFLPALKNLGINEFTLHQLPSSQKHLENAVAQAPNDPVINLFLGQLAYAQSRFKLASDRLRLAEDFVERDPNLRAEFGISLLKSGAGQNGLETLGNLKPHTLTPSNEFAVGLALAEADQPDRAVAYFEDLHEQFPNSYDIGFNLLVCYVRGKKAALALTTGNGLIQSGHDTDEVESAIAQAYEESNQTPKAVDALRRAIELAPANEENYLDFANLCIEHRDLDNGLKVVGVGLAALPTSSRLVFERGVLYAMQDRFELAEQDFERSARLAPMSNFGYVGIGVTYLESGHAAKAVEILSQRTKQHPNDASLLYLLGEALMRNGAEPGDKQYTEAQSVFERSIALNPTLCLPHVALGEIYIDEGRYKDAVGQLEKARSIDPKEKSVYSHLAVAYRKSGEIDRAKQTLIDLRNIYQQEQGWLQNRIKSQDSSSTGPPQ